MVTVSNITHVPVGVVKPEVVLRTRQTPAELDHVRYWLWLEARVCLLKMEGGLGMCSFQMGCLNLPVDGPLQACSKAYIVRLAGSSPPVSGWPGRRQTTPATTRRVSRIGGRVRTSSSAFPSAGGDRSSLWSTLRCTFSDPSLKLSLIPFVCHRIDTWSDYIYCIEVYVLQIGLIRYELVHTGKATRAPEGKSPFHASFHLTGLLYSDLRIRIVRVLLYNIFQVASWLGSCVKNIQ